MTLIIGENSNLTKYLIEYLEVFRVLSVRKILSKSISFREFKDFEINLIFNNFQTANKLNELNNPEQYIAQSIYATALILEELKSYKINKVIYTSSSSVYGNNKLCAENDVLMPLNLHASLKVANESLIEKYCTDRNIDYTIVRLFNMFGGEDKFSIVSKIINAFKNNFEITLINNGESIRDYVYIGDVVKIYAKLLECKGLPIINIGSGQRKSLKEILEYLLKHGFSIKTNSLTRDEIKVSIADIRLLQEIFGDIEFKKVEEYILEQIQT